jgi:hypothetical protein
MIRLLGGSLWASKAVRLALFCASVSLGVAALSPIAQAQPILILCSDDLAPQNFSCGTAASSNGGSSTAVGDAAAGFGTGTSAFGTNAGALFDFGTAIGNNATAGGLAGNASTAIGASSAAGVFLQSGTFHFSAGATAVGANAHAGAAADG